MKITVSTKEINDALKVVLKACPTKAQVPIITGILFDVAQGGLTLLATDYQISMTARINAQIEEDGKVVVSGKNIAEICAKLSGDEISFETEGNVLIVKSDSAEFSLLTLNAEDFPAPKVSDGGNYFAMLETLFIKYIKQVAYAAGDDYTRPIFLGVNFNFKKAENSLAFSATNTHRLATTSTTFVENKPFEDFSYNVPAKKLLDIISVIPQEGGKNLHFGFNENYFWIKFSFVLAAVRLIDGVFPPYEKVIPKETATVATVDTLKFKNAMNRVAVISKLTEHNTVKLKFDDAETSGTFDGDGALTISSTAPEGKAEEKFAIKMSGDPVEISFNTDYLLDALKTVETDTVTIKLNKSLAPIDFRAREKSTIHVITPVRTN